MNTGRKTKILHWDIVTYQQTIQNKQKEKNAKTNSSHQFSHKITDIENKKISTSLPVLMS